MLPTRMTSILNIHWNILVYYNLDPEPFFRKAGLDPATLHQQGVRCHLKQINTLWNTMVREIPDPCFGLKAAQAWHPSDLSALGYAALASKTLKETIERINRYQFAILGEFIIKTKITHNTYTVTIIDGLIREHYSSDDATLAVILSICRVNYRSTLNPETITFRHSKPPCSAAYYEFFGGQVAFDAKKTSMVFPLDSVTKILPGNNPKLTECSDDVLREFLNNLDKEKFIEKTKIYILRHLSSGNATEEQVAQDFYMSTRNFQRALKEHNTTFRNILNETRCILAKHYLEKNSHSLQETAFLLGYSSPSSFSRAFTSWTGIPPKQFHRNAKRA